MSGWGRILYACPDGETPSGGIKVIYSHVALLAKNGYPAFVLHNRNDFRPRWLSSRAPTLYVENGFAPRADDIVVIPEDFTGALEAFRDTPARKIVFCQSYVYVFQGLPRDLTWRDFGVSGVFCNSETVRDFLRLALAYDDVPIVHNAIARERLRPRRKKLQVAFMPRKRPAEIDFVRNLFERLREHDRKVPWIAIDAMDEETVARILGESAVFLSTGLYEGFGLPPLEAMACGCVVVGFHGNGGRVYATPDNGFWCEDGDLIGCARMLQQAVSRIESENDEIRMMREAALATVDTYTTARQERELMEFWRSQAAGESVPEPPAVS